MARILLLDANSNYTLNHRYALVRTLVERGHAVTVATSDLNPDAAMRLSQMGARFHRIRFKPSGMNPFGDMMSLYRIYTFIKKLQPEVFLGVTIKPSTLGVLAARLAAVPNRFALITGLGYAFTEGKETKRRIAKIAAQLIYKLALRFTKKTIFQNDDDRALFIENGLIKESQTGRINGSGVDLARYDPAALPPAPFTFLMISRLLEDKGVREYVAAARDIKARHPQVRFLLIGPRDQNPTAIGEAELADWINEGVVEYGGAVSDVRQAIAACHVFVLPSYYREGIPKTLLEALSMGRPIITSLTPGCRETVCEGLNGLLIPARDAQALVSAELELMADKEKLTSYGRESRALAERNFDVNLVVKQLLGIMTLN